MKNLHLKVMCSMIIIASTFSIKAQYSWTQKDSLTALGGRQGSIGFSIGHYGFVGMGKTASGLANDFWRWNQDSNTWTVVANYPGAGRWAMTSFTIGGNGYCCLGWTGSACATDLWEYDTATNSWTQKTSFPGTGRYSAFAFVIGTKAYVGCGSPNGSPFLEDVWVYDAIANTWTQVANFGGGDRSGLCAFSLNGYGYAGCGGNDVSTFNDLWKYDTTTNSWTNEASLPGTYQVSVSFVIDTLVYAGLGTNISSGDYSNNFFSYSATTNTWTPIASLPGVNRIGGIGFSIGNKGYAGMGEDSADEYITDFWQYGPIPTGINDIKTNNINFSLFPNPTNGIFNFAYSNLSMENAQLIITDVLGRTISEYTIPGKQGELNIDENQLSSGIYFYRVNSDEGLLTSGKFVIEK